MLAGSMEAGAPDRYGPDPALGPAIGEGGERRRHARALAGWVHARRAARFPRAGDGAVRCDTGGDTAAVLIELSDRGVRIAHVDAQLDRQQIWPDLLLDQILARVVIVRTQRTPLGFEADAWDGSAATVLRGILLPLADDDGELRYVQAVLSWKTIARPSGALTAAAACAEALGEAGSPVVWRGRLPEGSAVDRLAVARTWAALAKRDPLSRRASVDAALSAVFDAVLAGADENQTALIDEIFGDFSTSERRRLHLALAHATRLGLGAGGLSALTAYYPGGTAAFARLEVQIRKAERRTDAACANPPAAVRMRLVPIAPEWQREERRHAGREIAEGTPWSPHIQAADRTSCACETVGA